MSNWPRGTREANPGTLAGPGPRKVRCARIAIGIAAVSAGACAGPIAAVPHMPIAASSPSGLSLVWRNDELRPVGQPVAIGAVAVGVVTRGRHAFVVGIDPATGRALWQHQLSASWLAPDVELGVTPLGDDKVAYLRPVYPDTEDATLVVADARTGKDLAVSPPELFTSPPIVCANGRDMCALVYAGRAPRHERIPGPYSGGALRGPDRQLEFRLDVARGETIVEHKLPEWTRYLDQSGLIDLGDRPGNTLGLLRGESGWLTPAGAAFPSEFSSDNGFHWQLFREPHVFVGSLYGKDREVDGVRTRDLAAVFAMAGLSEHSGKVLWRDAGSGFPCPLSDLHVPVRCRATGVMRFHDTASSIRNFRVAVEGFDPATGRTTWSVAMGASKDLQSSGHPAIAGPHQVLLDGPRGPVVLDYATGHVAPPAPEATFWCTSGVRFDLSPAYYAPRPGWFGARHPWEYERKGGDHAFVCDRRGKPARALPSIAATLAVGARVGNYAVIATAEGYLGFQAPAQEPPPPASSPADGAPKSELPTPGGPAPESPPPGAPPPPAAPPPAALQPATPPPAALPPAAP